MTDKEKLEALEKYIKAQYKPEDGAKTVQHSQGNYDDVFSDGQAQGGCWALYYVANAIGLDVPEPHEQVYDWS